MLKLFFDKLTGFKLQPFSNQSANIQTVDNAYCVKSTLRAFTELFQNFELKLCELFFDKFRRF